MKSLINAIEFDHLIKKLGEFTKEEKLVSAYNSVRDIPYYSIGSRDPLDVLNENRGTSRGKHTLLRNLLESLGCEVQEHFAKHNMTLFPIRPWPEALASFQGTRIDGFHHFLKVKVGDRFVSVDATFDKALQPLGFPILQWDGKTDMALPVAVESTIQVEGEAGDHMKKLIAALPEDVREQRKAFLKALRSWLDEQRNILAQN